MAFWSQTKVSTSGYHSFGKQFQFHELTSIPHTADLLASKLEIAVIVQIVGVFFSNTSEINRAFLDFVVFGTLESV